MQLPSVPKLIYIPSKETLSVLNNQQWICSYSGGKDSTSLVTWIEWLRRIGMVKCDTPRLVQSDTEVEYPFLENISTKLLKRLSECGWQCKVVKPKLKDKLYVQIFGRGIVPIDPAVKKMRWCTRATKVDPMHNFAKTLGDNVIQLTGVRWNESARRDKVLSLGGCVAGGECGLPAPDDRTYGAIITWQVCQVIEWLQGKAGGQVAEQIGDLLEIVKTLLEVYKVKTGQKGFGLVPPKITALRFGCIGCPAVSGDKALGAHLKDNPHWRYLKRLYRLWEILRRSTNRVKKVRKGRLIAGPIKMEVRKMVFAELLEIQRKSGVTLVTEEDITFIHQCWENKVYPRGWSAEDE